MAFTRDVAAGPPRTLSHYTYRKARSVSKTRGTKLCQREQQTLLRLENGSHLYTPWRVQMDPSLPAIERGHCAMTSRNKSHCNCVLYVEDEGRYPTISIKTKANRFYHAWSLVIVDYGWTDALKDEKKIVDVKERDLVQYLGRIGVGVREMERQMSKI